MSQSTIEKTSKYLCFPGTQVPLACFLIHLQQGYTVTEFLQDFPSVQKEQVDYFLEILIEEMKKPDSVLSE
ncbi:DUF433 domain-containing protein [Flavilitoribacter nigricans]|uniref:DUF433 domain-containing protein n=1 Tax=Flavilitoribacter nigricans (strain ATCC 23147 / DSM 23189 / NBRC 102662 / NCIMB 1420 / SS-2) TaxID=1122177 RepID=A0A2D0NH16_FLAN2|nr:DUF433 domain-containing protein [Flavilitoribacter nigricans]PHN07781.1 hypothetical protein CRP01_04480 [Flavilitoribacter nigricans DSM 23189 = NBRC 102662]